MQSNYSTTTTTKILFIVMCLKKILNDAEQRMYNGFQIESENNVSADCFLHLTHKMTDTEGNGSINK